MDYIKKIQDSVAKLQQTSLFSGNIYFEDTKQTYIHSTGYANRSEQALVQPNTRFQIASGCKVFTAVAVCQLVEAGKIAFDSLALPIINESFPYFDNSITIHHLLTHTSGIPDYFDEETMDDFEALWEQTPMYCLRSPNDFLPLFQHQKMKFTPGARFHYNNAGYILLGLIVEKVSGISFTEYVETHIFNRCDMSGSGYFRMDQLPKDTALGYIEQLGGWRTNHYSIPIVGGPDGGAFTTVFDLTKFWYALFNDQLLNEAHTSLMLQPHIHADGYQFYGYGVWIVMIDQEVFKYYVMGSDPGVIMESSYYPALQSQLHVLGNVSSGARDIAYTIDSCLYEEITTAIAR